MVKKLCVALFPRFIAVIWCGVGIIPLYQKQNFFWYLKRPQKYAVHGGIWPGASPVGIIFGCKSQLLWMEHTISSVAKFAFRRLRPWLRLSV